MITPMIKYQFVLFHNDEQLFLQRISDVGVVDIAVGEYTPDSDELSMVKDINSLRSAIDTLTNYALTREITPKNGCNTTPSDMVQQFQALWQKRDELAAKNQRLEKELAVASRWGAFALEDVERLKDAGVTMRYFSASEKDYSSSLENEFYISKVYSDGSTAYFVAFEQEGEELTLPSINITEHRPLQRDMLSLVNDIKECDSDILNTETELDNLAAYLIDMRQGLSDMTFELRSKRIESSNRREADSKLIIVDGWVPNDSIEAVESCVAQMDGVISLSGMPVPEDNPPIKLKNSKLVSPVEMITRLFSLPNYHEVDMTPFFAPFFIFFVGICLGDALYGLVLFIGALVAWFKVKKSLKPTFMLVLWCSFAAMVMGAVTGMYGGITVEQTMLINSDQMFYFAIGVGVLQLLYAMLLRAYFAMKRFGFMYSLSHIGWVMTLVTLITASVMPMISEGGFSMESPLFTPLLIGSLILTIFFQDPKQNPLKNFGAGVWFLYNAATGMLSDTLSYVRLFALGLSGGIIASVFNILALELSPDIPVLKILVMIIILAIGHGINLFMSAISAFVHPLRLTFVEFYKNAGFEGGGRAYSPFTRNTNVE